MPAYEDVVFNGSFLLTNSYPAVSQPIAMPPNTREIGGYHIDPNPKPLPAVSYDNFLHTCKQGSSVETQQFDL